MIDKIIDCQVCHAEPQHNIDFMGDWDGYWIGCCAGDSMPCGENETFEHRLAFQAINEWNNMQKARKS